MVKRSVAVLFSGLDTELVMLDINRGNYSVLDQTSSRIWELIEESICVQDLSAQLRKEFDVSQEQCEADVTAFLQDMFLNGDGSRKMPSLSIHALFRLGHVSIMSRL